MQTDTAIVWQSSPKVGKFKLERIGSTSEGFNKVPTAYQLRQTVFYFNAVIPEH